MPVTYFSLGESVDTTNEADDGRHRNESVDIESGGTSLHETQVKVQEVVEQ